MPLLSGTRLGPYVGADQVRLKADTTPGVLKADTISCQPSAISSQLQPPALIAES